MTGEPEFLKDLKASGIEIIVSALTTPKIEVCDKFNHITLKKMKSWNLDPFDENREFHTEARVWTVSRSQALGI